MYPEDGSLSESGNNQGLNRMAYAMGLADIFVRMQYLSGLEDAQILPGVCLGDRGFACREGPAFSYHRADL